MDVTLGKKPREYILLQQKSQLKDGSKCILYQSIPYPNIGTDTIRGEIAVGSAVFTPMTDETPKTQVTHILHIDPKGGTIPLLINANNFHVMDYGRRIEAILGIPPPPKENWWRIIWGGKKTWEVL
eukprot:TRINITY_DN8754_c0_g1_i2.p1 TRINITY_DN8754_c0_g1~~TRINITY_DN8754_c0_g1_i2.p1  ORF type:complete len:126 (+),score=42.08 TRINITY_DN8754_c0_g1_i2:227-604(+)